MRKRTIAKSFLGFALLVAASVSVATPFKDIPRPVAGPSSLASLASKDELSSEAQYRKFDRSKLRQINGRYVLGERNGLSIQQLTEVYELVLTATAVKIPKPLCILDPRHYFTYTSEYGVVEVMMCFECSEAVIKVNDWSTQRPLSPAFLDRMNAIFAQHGVPKPISK